jgi:hypothetical protein
MKRIHTTDGPEFLKHHFPLSEDRIAKLVLPVNLTRKEAERISDFLDALVLEPVTPKATWPFSDDDTDEDDDDNDWAEEDLETLDITEADLEWTEPEPASEPEPESTPQAHGQTQP